MCYEESFFQRWARKRAQRRQQTETHAERASPVTQPPKPAPSTGAPAKPTKETERELEVV